MIGISVTFTIEELAAVRAALGGIPEPGDPAPCLAVPAAGAALDKVNAVVARLEKRLYDQALRTGQDIEFPLTPERFAAAFADVLFQCAWAEPGDDGQIHD